MAIPADHITLDPRRFSIRLPRPLWIGVAAVVLVVVAIGLQFGLPIYKQQSAIREIRRLNGGVEMRPRGPEWLRNRVGGERMKPFDDVILVDLTGTQATDATLGHVGLLTDLQRLSLAHTHVSDIGLAYLKELTCLQVLVLNNTQVTDVGLAHLKGLPRLQSLSLNKAQVTDAGVADLQHALPELRIFK